MDYFVFPTFFYYEKCIKTLHKPAAHELIPFTLTDGESVRNINS